MAIDGPEPAGGDQRPAAVEPDLLLRGRHGGDGRDARLFRITPQRLEDDERADPVVDGARRDPAVRQVDHARVNDAGVTHAEPRLGFGAGSGADVDPQVLELHRLLAVLALDVVDRLAADDAEHLAVAPANRMRWPTRTCGSQPPIGPIHAKPSSSIQVTMTPISSMWPASITVTGAPLFTMATLLPATSLVTSARLRGFVAPDAGGGGFEAAWAGEYRGVA